MTYTKDSRHDNLGHRVRCRLDNTANGDQDIAENNTPPSTERHSDYHNNTRHERCCQCVGGRDHWDGLFACRVL